MLPQNYSLAGRARLEILLILVLACNAEAASGTPAITSSSDVWAMLVANIGPLLVLVGEKHVKAYFKIMSKTSHHLLLASSPIGLVTAVTTLIRLDGPPWLKRLIGRQFEPRGQVLADVTSVSGGEVGLELRDMKLEPTTQPTEGDLAIFWVHGRTKGPPGEFAQTLKNWKRTLVKIHKEVTEFPSFNYERRCSSEIIMSFKAIGTCSHWVARKHAAETSPGLEKLLDRCQKKISESMSEGIEELATCTASAGVYARFTEVSLDLTASANYDTGGLEILRWAIVVFCWMVNIGIIIVCQLKGGTVGNTVLVGLGLGGSSCGSWLTARAVDLLSKEVQIDLSQLSTVATGFFSHGTPEGGRLSINPKKIALSRVPPRRWNVRDYARGQSATIIAFLMVISYITLYLGLRVSDWWVSLAMLGNSAIAAIARSTVVSQALYLTKAGDRNGNAATTSGGGFLSSAPGGSSRSLTPGEGPRSPNPMACKIGRPMNRRDLSHLGEHHKMEEYHKLEEYSKSEEHRQTTFKGVTDHVLSEPLNVELCETIVCQCHHKGGPSVAYDEIQPYIWTAFTLAAEMSKRGIAPLEMRGFPSRSAGAIGAARTAFIFSDIITWDGVWRQPLEVMAKPHGQPVPGRLLAVFWGWYWRASAHRAQKVARIELPPDLVNNFIDLGDSEEQSDIPSEKLKIVMKHVEAPREILWMGAKLCYASFYDWESNMFEARREAWFGGATTKYLQYAQISSFLDAIVAAGLTCERV
ncbi:hypothetical protein L873DRAFT_1774325 [Choiromyces venosus 120613-1]|uniref:Uncharacterized protein n=1 Tax=Choiromyces venosus 120613-1 TaxID=1336337 RepID=A0A3N4JFX2_9PEZI|nr:hypothetical protein L873DRAFT_1774325 [Choiromyces venosus 120613-1]